MKMKRIDFFSADCGRYILIGATLSVLLLLVSIPRSANIGPVRTNLVASPGSMGLEPYSEHTVAIYRNVTIAEMLAELGEIREALETRSGSASLALVVSIEDLEAELLLIFHDRMQLAYSRLSLDQQEAYNEVALLIADLKYLLQVQVTTDQEAAALILTTV